MKRLVILVYLLCAFSVGLLAQSNQEEASASIVFEKTTHDFGEIKKGSDAFYEFKFTNNGDAPLIVTEVKAFCSCNTAEWSKEPIAPGKTGIIKVKYDTTRRMGKFNKALLVSSNTKYSPLSITVKGNVLDEE